jgi:hypothetical protein
MVTIHLTGTITEDGHLEVALPDGLPPGKVQVTLEVESEKDFAGEECPWTEEEIREMMRITPMSGAEIVALLEHEGGWEDLGISDGAEWVREQRRKNTRTFPAW